MIDIDAIKNECRRCCDMSKITTSKRAQWCINEIEGYTSIINEIETIINLNGNFPNFSNSYKIKDAMDKLDKNNLKIGDKSMDNILETLDYEIELLQTDYLYTIEIIRETLTNLRNKLVDRNQFLITEEEQAKKNK